MIPSLDGGLYQFDGDTIERIPVTADHLLSSSYKFSEDLIISGKFYEKNLEIVFIIFPIFKAAKKLDRTEFQREPVKYCTNVR